MQIARKRDVIQQIRVQIQHPQISFQSPCKKKNFFDQCYLRKFDDSQATSDILYQERPQESQIQFNVNFE